MKVPHKLDTGKRRLQSLIAGCAPTIPALPLVHTTDTYTLTDIMDDGQLRPVPCDVYTPENLIYLFYGKPSFRPNIDSEPLSLHHYFPICMIFKPSLMKEIRRVLPFDSGAFGLGLYGPYLHKEMKLGDFLLEPDPATPGRIITKFFDSAKSYLQGQPDTVLNVDPSEFEAESLAALYAAKHSNLLDSRNSSIEIQIDKAIDITDQLIATIMPEVFASGKVGKHLRLHKIDVIPYPIMGRSRPIEYMGTIHQILMSYYLDKGIIGV